MKARHLSRLGAMMILGFAVSLFFATSLGSLDAFPYRPGAAISDLTVTFWPNAHYVQETWRTHRQIPLWRTSIFCGFPFDADPQSGLWYPPNALLLVLPATIGFNLLFLGHTVLGGLGMWRWARVTGTSTGGALLAALAYAFTPKTFAHLGFGHMGLVHAAAHIPWVLWAAYLVGHGSWRHTCVLGLALGWQFIAHPQLAFYTGLVAGTYGLATGCTGRAPRRESKADSGTGRNPAILNPKPVVGGLTDQPVQSPISNLLSSASKMALGAALALMVAVVQLLPMLRLAPLSARAEMGLSESAVSSLPPRYLWGLLLADHRGFMDHMLYAGIPVLALAALALLRRQARFWSVFVVVSLVYALGTNTPLYGWAFRLLPALAWLRAPPRIWFVAASALALLAGWGSDRLWGGLSALDRRGLNLAAVALGALAVVLLAGYAILFGKPPANLMALGMIAPATAVLFVVVAARRVPRWGAAAALAALLLADLWTVDATLINGRSREAVFVESGLGAFLAQQTDGEPFRVYSPSYSLPRHIGARYGLETVDGVDPLYLEEYAAYMEAASGVERMGYGETIPAMYGEGPLATLNRDAVPNLTLLGLLNVRYVAAEFPMTMDGLSEIARFGSTYLYEIVPALPRAFIVGQVELVESFDAALEWVRAQGIDDLRRVAAVEGGEILASGEVKHTIAWMERSPNRLILEVTLDRSAFLVLSQVWYPGWHAEVDGQPTTIWQADGVLGGVYMRPGKHTVTFGYRPWLTYIGGSVSGITVGALGLVGLGWCSRKRRGSASFPHVGGRRGS